MLIHLIRHTKPDIKAGICYGQTDLPLAASFPIERDKLRSKLLNCYDAIYTSPLRRCSILAESLTANQRYVDERLIEYNFGDWELLEWDQFTSIEAQNWMNNFVDQAAPNGESMRIMHARVMDFWTELRKKNYKNVAIVTHSGVQRLIHGHILKTPLSHLFRLQLDYGDILEVNSELNTKVITVKHL